MVQALAVNDFHDKITVGSARKVMSENRQAVTCSGEAGRRGHLWK